MGLRPEEALDTLERYFERRVKKVVSTALALNPPESEAWDKLLVSSQLTPCGGSVRTKNRLALGMTRGALPQEVRMVLHVLALQCRASLASLTRRWPALSEVSHPLSSRVSILKAQLERVVDEEGHRYDLAVKPAAATGAGLGMIFANARRSAKLDPWKGLEWRDCLTLTCSSCGAPQEEARNFVCSYCGQNIFARKRQKS